MRWGDAVTFFSPVTPYLFFAQLYSCISSAQDCKQHICLIHAFFVKQEYHTYAGPGIVQAPQKQPQSTHDLWSRNSIRYLWRTSFMLTFYHLEVQVHPLPIFFIRKQVFMGGWRMLSKGKSSMNIFHIVNDTVTFNV